jgi:hypothetical protein
MSMLGNKTKQPAGAEPLTPAEELQKQSQALVARVAELAAMREPIEQARMALRETGALTIPQLYDGGLWPTLSSIQRAWAAHRRDLVSDGPPLADPLEVAIDEARADVRNAEQKISYYERLLSEPGAAKDARLMGFAQNWVGSLKSERLRLGDLLSQVSPQTKEIQRERVNLLEPVAGLRIAA